MGPETQSKLLRVIQEKEFTPLGSNEVMKVDVRILAATNADLRKMVEEKKFREDLYYRLNVININLPPLRERREDIPLLIQHFLEKFSRENDIYTLFQRRPLLRARSRDRQEALGFRSRRPAFRLPRHRRRPHRHRRAGRAPLLLRRRRPWKVAGRGASAGTGGLGHRE